MTAKEFLFSKYPLVSPEWFDDNNLTQEMIKMMEEYSQLPLYAFLYCEDIHKHPFMTMSIHRTREGAEAARDRYKKHVELLVEVRMKVNPDAIASAIIEEVKIQE